MNSRPAATGSSGRRTRNVRHPASRPPVGDDDLEPDPDAALVDEFLAPARRGPGRPKPLRQSSPEQKVTRGDAWWVGLPRDVLSATAAAKAPAMSASQHGRSLSPVRGIS